MELSSDTDDITDIKMILLIILTAFHESWAAGPDARLPPLPHDLKLNLPLVSREWKKGSNRGYLGGPFKGSIGFIKRDLWEDW